MKALTFLEYIMWKATACMNACHKQYLYNKNGIDEYKDITCICNGLKKEIFNMRAFKHVMKQHVIEAKSYCIHTKTGLK